MDLHIIKPGMVIPHSAGGWSFTVIHPTNGTMRSVLVFEFPHDAKQGMREFVKSWNEKSEQHKMS